jgi:hypothetical protein
LNSGSKTKSEEIEWRRAKILELKSQGLDQREISQILHVSPTTINFDLQYLRKEARKTIREYTTEQLPLQLRIFMIANQNAIKQYWDISQKAQDNKEKIQALEHYLECPQDHHPPQMEQQMLHHYLCFTHPTIVGREHGLHLHQLILKRKIVRTYCFLSLRSIIAFSGFM